MDFKTILATLPSIQHLEGLAIFSAEKQIHYIPAVEGKLGSLRVFYALHQQFNGNLDRTSAEKGLQLFAEHVADAKVNVGKHPNIDLLLKVIAQNLHLRLQPIVKND